MFTYNNVPNSSISYVEKDLSTFCRNDSKSFEIDNNDIGNVSLLLNTNVINKSEFDFEKNGDSIFYNNSWSYYKENLLSDEIYRMKEFLYTSLKEEEIVPYTLSEIEEYVMDNYNEIVFYALNEIYSENINDSEMIIKIIRCLSSVPYRKLNSGARVLMTNALFIKDVSVKKHAIEALALFKDPQLVIYLKKLDIKESWMKMYVDKIIEGIENNGQ